MATKGLWVKLSGGDRGGMVVLITSPDTDIRNDEFAVGTKPRDIYRLVPNSAGPVEFNDEPTGEARSVVAQMAVFCGSS